MKRSLAVSITDFLYGVKRKTRRYLADNPGRQVIHAAGCKGIRTRGEKDVTIGFAWVKAKRNTLILSDAELVLGSWRVPVSEIRTAAYFITKGLLQKALVMKVVSQSGDTYQFGLNYDEAWLAQKVFPFRREEGTMKISLFSMALRLLLLGYLVYFILRRLNLI